MSRQHPDRGTVYGALSLAVRAPSVHNTQPWLWRIGDTSVHLYADPDLQVPATDPDGRDLVVSCGAALHHFRVALRAEGWDTTVQRTPNPHDPWHLAAVEMHPRTATDEDVLAASSPADTGLPLRAFPRGTLQQPDTDPNLPEGAALLVLATTDDDVRGRLRAGEALSAALLAATDLGLATCPLSQALEVADTRRFIETEVLDAVAIPQLLLRVGWAPLSAEPLPVSPRRPMDTVVAALDPAFDL